MTFSAGFHQVLLYFSELHYSFEHNLTYLSVLQYLLLISKICLWIHVAEDADTIICAKKHENCTKNARSKFRMYFFPYIHIYTRRKKMALTFYVLYISHIRRMSFHTVLKSLNDTFTWQSVFIKYVFDIRYLKVCIMEPTSPFMQGINISWIFKSVQQ
jgi:hypothetical protein